MGPPMYGGLTPLMIAARGGKREMVRQLLLHGAPVNAQTLSGQTALTFAAENGYSDIVELLKIFGAGESFSGFEKWRLEF